jgi:tripartite-type tricarboxylate transporter receptor subunit TctC
MIRLLPTLLLALSFAAPALAQGFPSKPIRVVIPYAAGGGTDNLVRIIAPEVSNGIGQQLVIDNRPGAASALGTEMVATAAPDGYTVLATDSAVLINPGLIKNLPFDTVKSLTGVTMLATAPVLLVVHPSVKANTVQELLALAKATPGGLNYASGGNGTSTHLSGELMKLRTGVDIVHVPYKGSAPGTTAVLSGEVQMQFTGISSAKAHLDAGKLRPVALTGDKRNAALPDVPTFEEAGVKGVDANTYWGVYAPAGTPPATLKILNEHFIRALRKPEVAERIAALGYEPVANTPEAHTEQMRKMIAQWTDVVQRAKIQVD